MQVRIDHMDVALSKTFKSPVMDTIQCLPQHQQIIVVLCCKAFPWCKERYNYRRVLNKYSYMDICKSILIPPVGSFQFSSVQSAT
ncbi:hypothetical protein RchiOBHm_Chr1g0327861 [Rosa chinensis]|uniref:Uncharacterized protein n=1 Tax=Rosa chinensis TaxID=74649 RepID=A0A2P6SAP6_ROSCH|nr:hypothetical protein RchiOBHm_Chr1g0327861 [Rosa chinensis]